MLIQDMLTGYLHEVPDQSYGSNFAGYGHPYGDTLGEPPQHYGQVLYDGLGNPVGFLPIIGSLLAPLAAKAVGALAPLAAKAIGAAAPVIAKALPMVSQALPGLTQAIPAATQAMPAATQVSPALIRLLRGALPSTPPLPWSPAWGQTWGEAQPSYAMGYYGEEITPPAGTPMPAPPAMAPPMPAPLPISPMPYVPMEVPCPSVSWGRRRRVRRLIRRPFAETI